MQGDGDINGGTSLLFLFLLVVALPGCDGFPVGKEDPSELQTIILEVHVEPSPVAVGDTTTFTTLIEDSLDMSFKFTWYTEEPGRKITEEPRLQWVANKDPGTYSFSVRADNGDTSKQPAVGDFFLDIIQNE